MDLRHHFRQLKLIAESSAFVFQWIKSSSVPSFAMFKPQHLNDFMFSLDSETRRHVLIQWFFSWRGNFIIIPSVNWWTPSLSHWSKNSVIIASNGLFQHTSGAWIYFVYPSEAITISILSANNFGQKKCSDK